MKHGIYTAVAGFATGILATLGTGILGYSIILICANIGDRAALIASAGIGAVGLGMALSACFTGLLVDISRKLTK